jgi:RHS repeat-associated protein
VSATLSGANVFYAHDGNKNVTDLIDASGNTVAHYEFDPSGNINVKTGALADTNPFRFSNEYSDEETGHIAYMLRYCNLGVGGWLNRDPIQEKGGANLYGFVQNNPVSLVDQNGQKAYLVYRPFDGALLKWGYPLIGHYYLAFDDTFSGNSAGLKKRWEQDVKSLSSSAYDRFLITFSFHPLEVRYSLLGDVQEGAGRIVSAFVTSGSFVAINDSKDQAAYTRATKWFGLGRGRTDTITDDYCEQLELFKQAVKSANSNNGGSPDPGVYQVLNRNCGTWAQLIINRAKLSYPLHEAVTGNAGGGIGGLSDITHTGDVITETFRSLYEAAEWADKTSESIFNAMGGFTFGWGAVK